VGQVPVNRRAAIFQAALVHLRQASACSSERSSGKRNQPCSASRSSSCRQAWFFRHPGEPAGNLPHQLQFRP
jgi:hypothetical protein